MVVGFIRAQIPLDLPSLLSPLRAQHSPDLFFSVVGDMSEDNTFLPVRVVVEMPHSPFVAKCFGCVDLDALTDPVLVSIFALL